MKDFIEALKKHGYKIGTTPYSGYSEQWIGNPGHPIHDTENEQPELAFWCLDEITRLGFRWKMYPVLEEGYTVMIRKQYNRGKTITEACCNALLSALEVLEIGK